MDDGLIKVLLIEDDPMVQEVNRQFIERVDGFQIIGTTRNGMDGIKLLKQLQPDLVLMDIYMPNQDGMETMYEIRKNKMDVDVIAITAANDPETIRSMLQNGAVDYIIKPFKFERIKQALEHYKSYFHHIKPQDSITQGQLDQMLHVKSSLHANEKQENRSRIDLILPKGLNQTTLEQIILYLLKNQTDSKSAEETADGIGIARVTARRYLDFLEKSGKVKLDVQYGGVGRPINRYKLIQD